NIITSTISILKRLHEEYKSDFLPDKQPKSLEENKFRDVAIFVPGASHGQKLQEAINKLNNTDEFFKKYPCLPLFISGESVETESEEYMNIFKKISDISIKNNNSKKNVQVA